MGGSRGDITSSRILAAASDAVFIAFVGMILGGASPRGPQVQLVVMFMHLGAVAITVGVLMRLLTRRLINERERLVP